MLNKLRYSIIKIFVHLPITRRTIHREPHRKLPPDKGHLQLPVGGDAAAVCHRQVRQSGRGRGVAQNLWRWVVADRRHRRVRSRFGVRDGPFLTPIFSLDTGQYVRGPSVCVGTGGGDRPGRPAGTHCSMVVVQFVCVLRCVWAVVFGLLWFFVLFCWPVYDNLNHLSPMGARNSEYRHGASQRVQSPEQSEHVRRRGVAQLDAAVRMITHLCYSEIAHGCVCRSYIKRNDFTSIHLLFVTLIIWLGNNTAP